MGMLDKCGTAAAPPARRLLAALLGFAMAAFFAMGLLAQSPATALAGDADDYDVQAQVQEQEQAQLQESFDISYEDVGAAWKNFRNSDVNMAITNANTPTSV